MKTFLYTTPKAGTYLIAAFLERMGLENTGYHISKQDYLDTRSLSDEDNVSQPNKASVRQHFGITIAGLRDGQLAFGHMSLPLLAWALPDFRFVCAYRHPRRTLLSEFIDFRFRRRDVDLVSRERIADDREAFGAYMRDHGPIHMAIFRRMVETADLFRRPRFKAFPPEAVLFVNFDGLREGRADPATAWAEAMSSETKTKANALDLDREAFWTPENEALAQKLQIDAAVARGRAAGLIL